MRGRLIADAAPDPRADERALVARAQAGDLDAFEALYRANRGRVYALCYRMAGEATLAEELAQDVFVRAWQRLGSFRGESAFSSWLHPLTVNVALSERRSRRRRTSRLMSTDDPAAFERPEARKTGPEAGVDLDRALRDPARGGARGLRPARRRGVQARGDRGDDGRGHRDFEGAVAPRPAAAQGGIGPMSCEQVSSRLDEYVDGDLDEASFQEIELHLGGCAECRQQERHAPRADRGGGGAAEGDPARAGPVAGGGGAPARGRRSTPGGAAGGRAPALADGDGGRGVGRASPSPPDSGCAAACPRPRPESRRARCCRWCS